jgi:hypothetical protein
MTEMKTQLRALMSIAAGEPPRRITAAAVRRGAVRRRMAASAAAATAAVLAGTFGAAFAAGHGGGPVHRRANTTHPISVAVPRYYVVRATTWRGQETTVRTVATGAMRARVHCPWPAPNVAPGVVAAADQQTFFLVCQKFAGPTESAPVAESRIYKFRITATGQASRLILVRGGSLAGLRVRAMAVTRDSSEIAVIVLPGRWQAFQIKIPADVYVINTRTGARAVWHAAQPVPGKTVYYPEDVSLTADGRDLAFLTRPQCFPGKTGPNCTVHGGQQVRVAVPAASGGQLNNTHVLVPLYSIVRLSAAGVLDAVISPDGSTLTMVIGGNLAGRPLPDSVSVVQIPTSGKVRLRTVYRMVTGNGYSYVFFSADASGRHFLLGAGDGNGPVNGWINHGRLIPLPPDPTTIDSMVW